MRQAAAQKHPSQKSFRQIGRNKNGYPIFSGEFHTKEYQRYRISFSSIPLGCI